jgi:hypothetical protein
LIALEYLVVDIAKLRKIDADILKVRCVDMANPIEKSGYLNFAMSTTRSDWEKAAFVSWKRSSHAVRTSEGLLLEENRCGYIEGEMR